MPLATHLGPWLIGSAKNNPANVGATIVTQSTVVSYLATAANPQRVAILPAGSQILNVTFYLTTLWVPGVGDSAAFYLAKANSSVTIADFICESLYRGSSGAPPVQVVDRYTFCDGGNTSEWYTLATPDTPARAAIWANVGSTDLPIYFAAYGTQDGLNPTSNMSSGVGTVTITYAVRNPNGTISSY